MQIAYQQPLSDCLVAFTIKGQTKAAVAFKGVSAIYWPILFKYGMQIAYRELFSVYFMAFTIKGQLKATAAIYWPFDSKGHKTNQGQLMITYMHARCEQNWSKNGRYTFKGQCGLCLAFDRKGHETKLEQMQTSYNSSWFVLWPLLSNGK